MSARNPMACGHPIDAATAASDGNACCRWCADVLELRAERDALIALLHPPLPSAERHCPDGRKLDARWECHWCAIRLLVDAQAEITRLTAELAAEREKGC